MLLSFHNIARTILTRCQLRLRHTAALHILEDITPFRIRRLCKTSNEPMEHHRNRHRFMCTDPRLSSLSMTVLLQTISLPKLLRHTQGNHHLRDHRLIDIVSSTHTTTHLLDRTHCLRKYPDRGALSFTMRKSCQDPCRMQHSQIDHQLLKRPKVRQLSNKTFPRCAAIRTMRRHHAQRQKRRLHLHRPCPPRPGAALYRRRKCQV